MLGPRPKKDCSAEVMSRRSGKLREKRKTCVVLVRWGGKRTESRARDVP